MHVVFVSVCMFLYKLIAARLCVAPFGAGVPGQVSQTKMELLLLYCWKDFSDSLLSVREESKLLGVWQTVLYAPGYFQAIQLNSLTGKSTSI